MLLAGCASSQQGLTLAPVGPASTQAAPVVSENGSLVVYSAYDVTPANQGDYEHRRHYTDYKILNQDGSLLKVVHNDSGSVVREAARVDLPPGSYKVVARANGYGKVTVPVVIEQNQLTTVHLEGGGSWQNEAARSSDQVVRLPDGTIVGWRAPTTNP